MRPNKRRLELLLQVVGLLQLEELPGELVQLADLTVAPGIHRRRQAGRLFLGVRDRNAASSSRSSSRPSTARWTRYSSRLALAASGATSPSR
jgi:hypothetical protein